MTPEEQEAAAKANQAGGDGLPQVDLDAVAAATARESAAMTGHEPGAGGAAPGQAPASTAGLRDRWGRAFDPELHVTRSDGTPALYQGKSLIVRAGKQGTGTARPVPATQPAPASRIGVVAEPAASPGAGQPVAADGNNDAAPQAAPTMTPEQLRTRAQRDSDIVRRGWLMAGRYFDPEAATMTPEELADVKGSAEDWLFNDGVQLPIGNLTLHLLQGIFYLDRVTSTPKGEARLRDAWRKVYGFFGGPAPKVPTRPQQQQQRDQEDERPARSTMEALQRELEGS